MEAVECRYRGRVIGWLYAGSDGLPRYHKADTTTLKGGMVIVWKAWWLK
jgi:hypothetical protein